MPGHHKNKHNRGTKRSSFTADANRFEALINLPEGENPDVRSSPKGSGSSSPKRAERTPSIPTGSSVYSRTPSAASSSIFSKDTRKASSASSNRSLTQGRAHSLASLPASNRSDSSLDANEVDDFLEYTSEGLADIGLPTKHINQIKNRRIQLEEKARAKAEAKAQRKKQAPRAVSRESLPSRASSHKGSGSSTHMRDIPSGLSSRTLSSSHASFGTSFDSYGNERRRSSAGSGSSCEDGSVISAGSAHAEIDHWGENVTEHFNSSNAYFNPELTQGITKTGYMTLRTGKSRKIKPQFVSRNSGIRMRPLPSDDGASSSSSDEILVTPQVMTRSRRLRTTKTLPKHLNYKPGDPAHNRMTNELFKQEYGVKRGGETRASFAHTRHTNDDDLESLGSLLCD